MYQKNLGFQINFVIKTLRNVFTVILHLWRSTRIWPIISSRFLVPFLFHGMVFRGFKHCDGKSVCGYLWSHSVVELGLGNSLCGWPHFCAVLCSSSSRKAKSSVENFSLTDFAVCENVRAQTSDSPPSQGLKWYTVIFTWTK